MPTRVSYNTPSADNHSSSTTPKTTSSFDVQAGDLIVVKALQNGSPTLSGGITVTPSASGGSVTWTERVDNTQSGQYRAIVGVWTGAVAATATGITVTLAAPQAQATVWGFSATVWRNHGGVGTTWNAFDGSVTLAEASATCSAGSAVDGIVGDSWGNDGAARVWSSINGTAITESFYYFPVFSPTVYEGYHLDVGAAGSKTFGLSDPDMQYSIGAVEILAGGGGTTVNGTAGAAYGYTATASGVPRTPGTAASTWTLTATANGIDRTRGQAVATLSFTGTAAGIDRARGTASATIGWTGAASGTARTRGTAAATWGLTATAAGEVTILATAAATYTFTGTASGGVGDQPVEGTATNSIGFTGTASGRPRVVAAAVTTFAWSGTAAGVDRSLGTAAATIAWTATATGVDRALGVAVGTYTFTGTAVGDGTTPAVEGTASAAIGWTTTAAGRRRVIAAIATTYALTATARGVNLSIVTPAERTIAVPAENRIMVVPAENRVIVVPAENRIMEA